MNYRHIYHAGNFADVFKHWVLTLILEKLCQKDAPFCLVDTHAGLGFYNLQHDNAQTTLEYTTGLAKLEQKKLAPEFAAYSKIIDQFIKHNVYPGSPAIMQEFLRANDRLFLNELHPQDYLELSDNFKDDRRVKVLHDNAYTCLKALLPPKERRGLVLIDPAYEQKDEFAQIIQGVREALKRFATGIYLIWYPIKERKQIEKFYRSLEELSLPSCFYVEMNANQNISTQLTSNGLIVINPPWQLDTAIYSGLPKLLEYLDFKNGTYKLVSLATKN